MPIEGSPAKIKTRKNSATVRKTAGAVRAKRFGKKALAAMSEESREKALAMNSGWMPPAGKDHPQYDQSIRFVFPIKAEVKERARTNTETGITFTPVKTREFEAHIAQMALLAMHAARLRPFEIPVSIAFAFIFAGHNSFFPVGGRIGDLSNLMKAVEDAMNKIVYLDDRLIQQVADTVKIAGPQDCIVVEVRATRGIRPLWLE